MGVIIEELELLEAALHGLGGKGGAVGGGGDFLELQAAVIHGFGGDEGRISVSGPVCENCWVEGVSDALGLLAAAVCSLSGGGRRASLPETFCTGHGGGDNSGGGGVLRLLSAEVLGLAWVGVRGG